MDIFSAFPSKYLKTSDLNGQPVRFTIRNVVVEIVDDDSGDQKPVVHFEESSPSLCLNKTNANTIADAFGAETDGWVGRQLELYPARTDFRGRTVDCLRVRPIGGTQGSAETSVTPDDLRHLINSWKTCNPQSAEDIDEFRSWVEKNIGLNPELALSPNAWNREALSTAASILEAEDVPF